MLLGVTFGAEKGSGVESGTHPQTVVLNTQQSVYLTSECDFVDSKVFLILSMMISGIGGGDQFPL